MGDVFAGIKRTVTIAAGNHKAVLYAYKKEVDKFVGLFDESRIHKDILAKKYSRGKQKFSVYNLFDETSYLKKEHIKNSAGMYIQILPFCRNDTDDALLKEIGIDAAVLNLFCFFKSVRS